ncbi:hypothetical protein [Dactylosporangium sp. NPDC048998]|uniref:protein-tyrosine phosphatase family protein n=1 Tax=Dactylosporangium sp. NPDC048998 TaxID=3363976 RepID=UPI0037194B2C
MSRWRRRYHGLVTRLYGPDRDTTWLTWIGDERVAVGSVPTAATIGRLAGQGVTHVVNCRSGPQTWISQDLAVERAIFGAAAVAHAPMHDHGRPQPPGRWSPAAEFAATVLDADPAARVLVHCQQGRHRSAMLAYAVLRLRGHSPAAATELITTHRTEARLLDAYTTSVERWLTTRAGT